MPIFESIMNAILFVLNFGMWAVIYSIPVLILYVVISVHLWKLRDANEELAKGSVLDPLSHPSYGAERSAELKASWADYENRSTQLKSEYGEFFG